MFAAHDGARDDPEMRTEAVRRAEKLPANADSVSLLVRLRAVSLAHSRA